MSTWWTVAVDRHGRQLAPASASAGRVASRRGGRRAISPPGWSMPSTANNVPGAWLPTLVVAGGPASADGRCAARTRPPSGPAGPGSCVADGHAWSRRRSAARRRRPARRPSGPAATVSGSEAVHGHGHGLQDVPGPAHRCGSSARGRRRSSCAGRRCRARRRWPGRRSRSSRPGRGSAPSTAPECEHRSQEEPLEAATKRSGCSQKKRWPPPGKTRRVRLGSGVRVRRVARVDDQVSVPCRISVGARNPSTRSSASKPPRPPPVPTTLRAAARSPRDGGGSSTISLLGSGASAFPTNLRRLARSCSSFTVCSGIGTHSARRVSCTRARAGRGARDAASASSCATIPPRLAPTTCARSTPASSSTCERVAGHLRGRVRARGRVALADAAVVEEDHVERAGEQLDDRLPAPARVAEPLDQEQRRSRSVALPRDPHRSPPAGRAPQHPHAAAEAGEPAGHEEDEQDEESAEDEEWLRERLSNDGGQILHLRGACERAEPLVEQRVDEAAEKRAVPRAGAADHDHHQQASA